jgi:hypothetical protein
MMLNLIGPLLIDLMKEFVMLAASRSTMIMGAPDIDEGFFPPGLLRLRTGGTIRAVNVFHRATPPNMSEPKSKRQ